MPELPEMENYKFILSQKIIGKTITSVQVNREKSINVSPEIFLNQVQGQKIINVERRAKHLIFYLENGNILLLHLMLGGWMFYGTQEDKPKRTVQIQFTFGQEHLYFIGLRLGYLHLYNSRDLVEKELSDLGPEPLDLAFTLKSFEALVVNRRGRLKTKLVDQQWIAGIGNCYSDEICFHAGVLPTRGIENLNSNEVNTLYHSIQYVLRDATKHGGYMENPLYKGDTLTGGYNNLCKVYDCEGQDCPRCGHKILKGSISSRKTFYCSNCQK
ncbi:Fpg/Nei family DNA glycosylase [Neobacillus sp. D3-1R]|uniref:Fpg/Nei family DNA glycosylase n=1 Tax=Neobacillus sp. D3-1R TaxID=3445778 RepID=UPI003FA10298